MKALKLIPLFLVLSVQLFSQGLYDLRGDWNHNGNGHKTKLVVSEQNGNKFTGTMHGNPLINGEINGNTVTFTRNISQRQDYTGTITTEKDGTVRMSGTFTQLGTNTVYKWNSEKIEKTAQPTPSPATGSTDNLRGEWNNDGNAYKTKLVVSEQLIDHGIFQIHLLPEWKYDENATDKDLLTFKHYINGKINYNVRIKQQPVVCLSSKDFNNQMLEIFQFQNKKGDQIDEFKPKSEYTLLGHSNCHMMTYIDKKTDHRGFILNAHVDGKRYSFYIFDYVNKKKELRKEVIDFIAGISLIDTPQPFIAKNQNTSKPKGIDKVISFLDDVLNVLEILTETDSNEQVTTNKNRTEKNKTSETKDTPGKENQQNNNKTATVTPSNKPEAAKPSFNFNAMANIPPSKPVPFLDIITISKTEWDGAVSAAMEGMRLVYGPMEESENKQFEKSWAPLRQTPFEEAVDYLNKFNPLLGEFLTYRTTITQTSNLLEEAVQNAAYAAEYDDPELSFSYLDLASKYQTLLISRQKRLQQITDEIIALGNPPDGAQMMAERQRRYKQEKDYLKNLIKNDSEIGENIGSQEDNVFNLEGCWAGYTNTFWDQNLGQGYIHLPSYFYIFKVRIDAIDRYYSIALCDDCGGANNHKTKLYCINYISDSEIREKYKSDNYILEGNNPKNINYGKEIYVAKKFSFPNIPDFPETSNVRYQILIDAAEKHFDSGNAENLRTSYLNPAFWSKEFAPAFFNTAALWTKENKWQKYVTPYDGIFWNIPPLLLEDFSNDMASGSGGEIAQNTTKPNDSSKPNPTENENITDKSNFGGNNLHIIDDKNPEDRRKIDAEAIEFHNTNLAIIQKNMIRDQEELTKEKDPNRIKDYEMRILGAQANIQAEKDRIATIQTGVVVFNRSPWDDYAKSNFIQNIAKDQQKMENISRGIRKAYEMADKLPDEEARKVRNIINEKYNGKIMAEMDEKAAYAIIEEANSVGKKYYQGKIDAAKADKKVADEESEWAESCLWTAEMVKGTADKSMTVLSLFGGKYVNTTYQGITGYIEGGPKEAFLRVSGSYNSITSVAVDGFRGFENAVNQGGDFVDGALGAGWEVTKGIIISKAMSYGASKLSSAYNRPNGDLPNVDGPDGREQTTANKPIVGQKNVGRVIKPDFNRPLTTQEIAAHRAQIADGRNKVDSYKKTYSKLETARKSKAPPSEIKKILIELDDRSAKIHSSPQAKMMMKTMQKHPKNLDLIKRYSNSMDRIHTKVEKRYQAEMSNKGWAHEELTSIRNRPDPADLQRAREMQARGETVSPEALLGSKTVNMDYDAGRKPALDSYGKPVPPSKNGKPVPVEAWHAEAQAAWEKAYVAETGQSPTKSWENITHGKMGDAYADLNVLQKNGILQANKQWAGQTADVSYYKAEHLRGSPEFQRAEKYVEIARGTSKDCRTKMMPLFNQKKPKAGTPSHEAWQKHKNYWEKVNGVLNEMGSGKKDPMIADREIRQISGGKSVLEVTFDMRNFMESLLLLGN